jgi:hypothetical protein
LERNGPAKASKIRGKITPKGDFLIDGGGQKVVISNSSGNYNKPPAFH